MIFYVCRRLCFRVFCIVIVFPYTIASPGSDQSESDEYLKQSESDPLENVHFLITRVIIARIRRNFSCIRLLFETFCTSFLRFKS